MTCADTISLVSRDGNGKPQCSIDNFLTIMRNDDFYADVHKNILTDKVEVIENGKKRLWSDVDEAKSVDHIEKIYSLYNKDKHRYALNMLFDERAYHPIIDLITATKWDGQPRRKDFLIKYAKAEESEYAREVSRLIFDGGIARLHNPGCKFDDVPVLIGRQGGGKSTLVRWLAVKDEWYGAIKQFDGNVAIEQLFGKWILEIEELAAMTKAKEVESVKAFITRQVDSYRKPYAVNVADYPRRCIFVGSTNNQTPFSDLTGNRRYYPVNINSDGYEVNDVEQECRAYILQCWAEAEELWNKGEIKTYADRNLRDAYLEAQEAALQDDPREGEIGAYLDSKSIGDHVCIKEIWVKCLHKDQLVVKDLDHKTSKDIGAFVMRVPGWSRCGAYYTEDYGKQRGYVKEFDRETNKQQSKTSSDDLPF